MAHDKYSFRVKIDKYAWQSKKKWCLTKGTPWKKIVVMGFYP